MLKSPDFKTNTNTVGTLAQWIRPRFSSKHLINLLTPQSGLDPASEVKGTNSVIFDSQISLRVHYCEKDEIYFTTLL